MPNEFEETSDGNVRVKPNPYQSPFPDEFLEENVQKYEGAIETLEGTIVGLRDWIAQLEGENQGLRELLAERPVYGFQMETADID